MKVFLQSSLLVVGIFLVFILLGIATNDAGITCIKCNSSIEATAVRRPEAAKADMKCSGCGLDIRANTAVTKVTCPSCKTEFDLCPMCAKTHTGLLAKDARGQAGDAMKQANKAM